jgi:hypothetical protein
VKKKTLLSFHGAKPLAVHHQLEFGTSTCICFRFVNPHFQWIKKKTPPNPSAILRREFPSVSSHPDSFQEGLLMEIGDLQELIQTSNFSWDSSTGTGGW